MKRLTLCVLIAVLAFTTPALATNIYSTEASFLTAIAPGYYLEDFSTYTWGSPLDGSQITEDFGPVMGYSWEGYAPYGLWSAQSALSVASSGDALTITFTGLPVTAVGGIFAPIGIGTAQPTNDLLTVTLNDGTSVSYNGLYFAGFTSDIPIVSLTIDCVDGSGIGFVNWPQVDHFYAGSAATSIPAPATMLLFVSGLLGLAGFKKKVKN